MSDQRSLNGLPMDGRTIDLHRFAELGRQGVLALFADSTSSWHWSDRATSCRYMESMANWPSTAGWPQPSAGATHRCELMATNGDLLRFDEVAGRVPAGRFLIELMVSVVLEI